MKSNMTTLCYIEKDDSYLMMHRIKKENDINKDKWIGVGGHFEADESPEECLLREVREETGLTLTSWRLRGFVTFICDRWQTEYMFLYTADGYDKDLVTEDAENPDKLPADSCSDGCVTVGKKDDKLPVCDEGVLEWVKKSEVYSLPIWEGDRIFFRLLEEDRDVFSLKLRYENDELVEAVLDGETMETSR